MLNDREEKSEPSELGILAVVAHSVLCAMGMATLLISPLPMIVAAARLSDPWPKVVGVFGAVVALTFLEVPPSFVVISFVVGMFIADGVARQVEFWKLLRQSGTLALLTGLGTLVVWAQWERVTPLTQWVNLVHGLIGQFQSSVKVEPTFGWAELEAVFLYEGPFLFLAGAFLAFWLSVGVASHMGWLSENPTYSGKGLRALRLPTWASAVFVGLFLLGTFVTSVPGQYLVGGLYRLVAVLMFVQGCVCLSELLERREVRPRVRTLVFSLAILVGFYAVMGMGVMGPWIFRKRENLNLRLEEAL